MNNYLKNRYATYFLKLYKNFKYDDYNLPHHIDTIFNVYSFDKNEIFTSSDIISEKGKEEVNQIKVNFLANKLRNFLKNKQNLNCLLKKKIEYIFEIYNLNEDERIYIEYLILEKIEKKIAKLATIHYDYHDYYKISKLFNFQTWYFDSMRNKLQVKGILSEDDSDELNSKLLMVIGDNTLKSKSSIMKKLIGTSKKTVLTNSDFIFFKKEQELIQNILQVACKNKTKGINILLYGGVGTGKTEFAKLVAKNTKINMYEVDFPISIKQQVSRYLRVQDLFSKQEILSRVENSCVLFDEAEDIMNNFTSSTKAYLNNLLENINVPTIWTTNNIYSVDPAFLRRMTYTLEFRTLTEEERLVVWNNLLKKNKFKVSKSKIIELNRDFNIAPSLISNAIKTTKLINGSEDDFETFIENVAKVVYKKKNVKNKKEFIFKGYNENLVNTDLDTKKLTQRIKNCRKLNFSLCLYGEPGTGKSLYARYLAKQLGLEVVFKRASDLISPYVGETEQNIAEAFAEAKSKKAMLIFDEADSFLQNRNNAVNSWEVSQVNEMLTWMESHEYPFVCTTNLLETLDEASLRRFTFKIRFDFFTKEQVNEAIKHFFNIENPDINIKGLTAGDFATVKKKADFLGISDINEITNMLYEEVKLKQSKELKSRIGF